MNLMDRLAPYLTIAAFVAVLACGGAQPPPPVSLACRLTVPPPVWYEAEASPLAACLEVAGVEVPQGPCCPADTVCLTKRGGQALIVDAKAFRAWTDEAWLRCRSPK